MSRVDPRGGLGIPDVRLRSTALVAKGAGVLASAYTEAGPEPGHPVSQEAGSRWRPQITQAQSESLEVYTARGGYAGRNQASVLYRLDSETTQFDWRGWDEPNCVTEWTAPNDTWGSSETWDRFACAVIAETGVIVVVGWDDVGVGTVGSWSYNPRTGVWTVLGSIPLGSAFYSADAPLGMVYDPDYGRLILYTGETGADSPDGQVAYFSEDAGVTWSLYARGFLDISAGSANSDGAYRPVVHPTADWLLVRVSETDGTGTGRQLASSDRGVTWDDIGSMSGGTGFWPVLGPIGFVVLYIDSGAQQYLRCKTLGAARAAFGDATEVTISDAREYSIAWGACDADGILYVYALGEAGAADQCWVFRSLDGGLTWTEYTWLAWETGSSTKKPEPMGCVASAGRVWTMCTLVGDTSTDGTMSLIGMGGWSNVAGGVGEDKSLRFNRVAWGSHDAASDAWGAFFVPFASPEDIGWTRSTGTGTRSLSPVSGAGLLLTTTAGQAELYNIAFGTNKDYCTGIAKFQVASSGSSTLATIGTGNTGCFILPALRDNGVYGYDAQIDIGTDGIQVRDGSTIRGTAALDTTAQPTYVRWFLTKGHVWVWYKTSPLDKWTYIGAIGTVETGLTISDAGAGTATDDRLVWGQGSTAVGKCLWMMVNGAVQADAEWGVDSIAEALDASVTTLTGHQWGKSVPGFGEAYPVPEGTGTSEELSLITARGGVTRIGEVVDLPAVHLYGVDNLHPDQSASPRDQWRATGTSEVRFVYDLGDESWFGGAFAIVALNCDFREAILQLDDGAGGVTTMGTLDKGSVTIDYTLVGDTLIPRSGTATIDRYFQDGEATGGYVTMSTAGSPVARRIVSQTPGFWTTSASQQRVRIRVEGLDGTETASGSGAIVHPSGIQVIYPTTENHRRYLVLKLASGQAVPNSTYKAGILTAVRLVGLGSVANWGNQIQHVLQRAVTRRSDGGGSVRELGPLRRRVSYDYQVPLLEMRTLAIGPNYVGVQTGIAIGTQHDTWSAIVGMLANELRSGEMPVLFFPVLPAADGNILDKTLYVYGLWASESIDITQTQGKEGRDEFLTVTGFAVEEIP